MVATEFVTPAGAPNPAAAQGGVDYCLREKTLLITCGTYDQAVRIIPPLVVT